MADEYYEIKCPVCDNLLTSQLFYINSYFVTCPHCNKKFNLYTLIGYNMFNSEKGLATKTNKRPIPETNISDEVNKFLKYTEEIFSKLESNEYYEDIDDEERLEGYIQGTIKIAQICSNQFHSLLQGGFTRSESINILKQLIDSKIIF